MKRAILEVGNVILAIGEDDQKLVDEVNALVIPHGEEVKLEDVPEYNGSHRNHADGEIALCDITDRLYEKVEAEGGDLSWTWNAEQMAIDIPECDRVLTLDDQGKTVEATETGECEDCRRKGYVSVWPDGGQPDNTEIINTVLCNSATGGLTCKLCEDHREAVRSRKPDVIKLSNDFHNTTCYVMRHDLSPAEVTRAKRILCIPDECTCSDFLGRRGEQESDCDWEELAFSSGAKLL